MDRRSFFGWLAAAAVAFVLRRPIPPRPDSYASVGDLLQARTVSVASFGNDKIADILAHDMAAWNRLVQEELYGYLEPMTVREWLTRPNRKLAGPIRKLPG